MRGGMPNIPPPKVIFLGPFWANFGPVPRFAKLGESRHRMVI